MLYCDVNGDIQASSASDFVAGPPALGPVPLAIVGPTASGKTEVAIALARRTNGEIVNTDSMQVYRGMDIGTAKPTLAEREKAVFHLLDLVTPDQPFSVADWKRQAEAAIHSIERRRRTAILCGGTGMYLKAYIQNWSLADTPAQSSLRTQLRDQAAAGQLPQLYSQLQQADPTTAERLHPNDHVRIVRALEVFLSTGEPISTHQQRDRARQEVRSVYRFGLLLPRPILDERISLRVESMMAQGLEEEVRGLLAQGYSDSLAPLQSLGYKEMAAYLRGAFTREAAVEAIKQATRQFARRQMTWFRADKQVQWLEVQGLQTEEVANQILTHLQNGPLGRQTA